MTKKIISAGLIFIASLVIFSSSVNATLPEYGGKVVDQNGQGIGGVWVEWKSGPGGNSPDGTPVSQVTKYVKTNTDGSFFFRQVFNKPTTCQECSGKWTYPNVNDTDPGYCYRSRQDPVEGCLLFDEQGVGYTERMLQTTRIDTDLDGAPDRFYIQSNPAGRATFDLNCYSAPHIISVVIPKNKPGLVCDSKDVTPVQNGQARQTQINCRYTPPEPTEAPAKQQQTSSIGIDDASDGWNNFACVNAQACNNETNCPQYPEDSTKRRIRITDLQQLNLDAISNTNPLYIVECLTSNTDPNADGATERSRFRCSSGNSSVDSSLGITSGNSSSPAPAGIRIFGSDGRTVLQNGLTLDQLRANNYTLYMESNVANTVGSVITVAYKGLSPVELGSGSQGGLQQATLDFSGACFFHDPYGRVFDAHTLEPLRNASVTLNRKNENGSVSKVDQASVGIGFVNPQITQEDGLFAFLVPDGTYRLAFENTGYIGISPLTGVKAAHTFLYENIYDGGDIVQEGSIVQTDVPLKPFNTAQSETFARLNPVTLMEYFQSTDPAKQVYRVEGRTSHPLAVVELAAGVADKNRPGVVNKTRTLARSESDKYGRFVITFEMNKLRENEIIRALTISKPSMYLGADTDATKTVVEISPLLTSLNGTAYDEKGAILPGAKVAVLVPMSSNPVYETTADEQGRFVIPESYIPSIEYELSYVPVSGDTIRTTTDVFFAQNRESNTNSFVAARQTTSQVLGISDERSATVITLVIVVAGGLGVMVLISVIASAVAAKKLRSKKS